MAGKKEFLEWRTNFSAMLGTLWAIVVIAWLYFYAGSYNVYQNIAVVLLTVLVVAIIKCLAKTYLGVKDGAGKLRWNPWY